MTRGLPQRFGFNRLRRMESLGTSSQTPLHGKFKLQDLKSKKKRKEKRRFKSLHFHDSNPNAQRLIRAPTKNLVIHNIGYFIVETINIKFACKIAKTISTKATQILHYKL